MNNLKAVFEIGDLVLLLPVRQYLYDASASQKYLNGSFIRAFSYRKQCSNDVAQAATFSLKRLTHNINIDGSFQSAFNVAF